MSNSSFCCIRHSAKLQNPNWTGRDTTVVTDGEVSPVKLRFGRMYTVVVVVVTVQVWSCSLQRQFRGPDRTQSFNCVPRQNQNLSLAIAHRPSPAQNIWTTTSQIVSQRQSPTVQENKMETLQFQLVDRRALRTLELHSSKVKRWAATTDLFFLFRKSSALHL